LCEERFLERDIIVIEKNLVEVALKIRWPVELMFKKRSRKTSNELMNRFGGEMMDVPHYFKGATCYIEGHRIWWMR
jgi:hypothetical protein